MSSLFFRRHLRFFIVVAALLSGAAVFAYNGPSFNPPDGSGAFAIGGGGKVGIGTSNPSAQLHLVGGARIDQEILGYTADVVPTMTSNNTPAPVVINGNSEWAGGGYSFYKAFNDVLTPPTTNAWLTASGVTSAWIYVDFGSAAGNRKTIRKYTIQAVFAVNAPKDWTFEGSNDGAVWTVLDTRANQTSWADNGVVSYAFPNSISYRYYRLNVTSVQAGGGLLAIGEMQMMEAAPSIPRLYVDSATGKVGINTATNLSGLLTIKADAAGTVLSVQDTGGNNKFTVDDTGITTTGAISGTSLTLATPLGASSGGTGLSLSGAQPSILTSTGVAWVSQVIALDQPISTAGAPGATIVYSPTCPAGKKVTGGGCYNTALCYITSNAPVVPPGQWLCQWTSPCSGTGYAYVSCK